MFKKLIRILVNEFVSIICFFTKLDKKKSQKSGGINDNRASK